MESYISRTSGIKARDKIGYAFGDLASCLVFGLTQSVLNKFYTDVLEISVLNVMIMTIIARIWDAVNDPIWGRLIDGAKLRSDGRYRHWIKIFALPVALAAVLMFLDVRGFDMGGRIAWIYVTYILFGMLYTCINIPYGSLAQVITSDDKERSSLSVFRSIGSTFGAMPAMVLASVCYVTVDGVKQMDAKRVLKAGAHRRHRHRRAVRGVLLPLLRLEQGASGVEARPQGEGPDHEGGEDPAEEPGVHGGESRQHAVPGGPDVRPGV